MKFKGFFKLILNGGSRFIWLPQMIYQLMTMGFLGTTVSSDWRLATSLGGCRDGSEHDCCFGRHGRRCVIVTIHIIAKRESYKKKMDSFISVLGNNTSCQQFTMLNRS